MGHAASKTPADPRRAQARGRIARAYGHLHGILDMIDDERDYSDILPQIGAVRAALEHEIDEAAGAFQILVPKRPQSSKPA